jgi:hypothetical protein
MPGTCGLEAGRLTDFGGAETGNARGWATVGALVGGFGGAVALGCGGSRVVRG